MNWDEVIAKAVGFDGSRADGGFITHHSAWTRDRRHRTDLGIRPTFAVFDESHMFANPNQKGTTMARTEVIESRLRELEAELADIKRFGKDEHEDGTVLTFKADFNGNRTFTYAAIKAGGRWHLTGSRAQSNLSWDAFVEFMRGANVRKVRKVTETERVV